MNVDGAMDITAQVKLEPNAASVVTYGDMEIFT